MEMERIWEVIARHHSLVRSLELEAAVECGFITDDEALAHHGCGYDLAAAWNRLLSDEAELFPTIYEAQNAVHAAFEVSP